MIFPIFRLYGLALFFGAFLPIFLIVPPVLASSVFTVNKIYVDASAPTTSQARTQALREGQQQALKTVLRRLTKQAEWELLPDITTLNVEEWVEGFRVRDEKTGLGRYLARMSVQFKPEPLRRLLRATGVSITEVQSRPYLLLPVLEDAQGLQAWGDNWWRDSWLARDLSNNPAPLILPLGDLDDTIAASAEDILIGHPDKLMALNDKYATETIIVAHGLADIAGQLGVTVYIFEPDKNDVIVRTYRTGAKHEAIAGQAVDDVLAMLAERWKNVAAIASDEIIDLRIRTEFLGLRDWNKILMNLDDVKLVRGFAVSELSLDYAYLHIWHIGTTEQLTRNFAQNGLSLEQSATGWRVYLNDE